MHDKPFYNNLLHENICVVVFTKKNGEERTMRCTLKKEAIDAVAAAKGGKATDRIVSVPDHQVRVVDLDKNDWRSFDVDSVITFTIENQQPQ